MARPGRGLRIVAALLCLVASTLRSPSFAAETPEVWNDVSYTVARSGRFEVTAQGTLRFAQTIGDLYDRRVGTRVGYELARDLHVEGGYLWLNRDAGGISLSENRLLAGISYPLVRTGILITGRTVYERHVVPTADFNRLQQRFEISSKKTGLSPWLYQQFTFQQSVGFMRSRSRFGLWWRGDRYSFRAAYQFETLSVGTAWIPRHAIYTQVVIERPLWSSE